MVRAFVVLVTIGTFGCGSRVDGAAACSGGRAKLTFSVLEPGAPLAARPAAEIFVDDARTGCVIASGNAPQSGRLPNTDRVFFRITGDGLISTVGFGISVRPPTTGYTEEISGIPVLSNTWAPALPPFATDRGVAFVVIGDADPKGPGRDGYTIEPPVLASTYTTTIRYLSETAPYVATTGTATTSSGLATIEGLPLEFYMLLRVTRGRCSAALGIETFRDSVSVASDNPRFQ